MAAVFALVFIPALAAIGLFGVMAYLVSQRTREIGVRLALGARAQDVQRTIVGSHLAAGALGLTAGAALALRGTVLLQQVSADVRPDDPALFVAAGAVLASVMFVRVTVAPAVLMPARVR